MADDTDWDDRLALVRLAAERLRVAQREIGDELRAFVAQLSSVRHGVVAARSAHASESATRPDRG